MRREVGLFRVSDPVYRGRPGVHGGGESAVNGLTILYLIGGSIATWLVYRREVRLLAKEREVSGD